MPSGTAALTELGRLLKASKLKNNNYLFVAFSGEELGLFGSKYFTEHSAVPVTSFELHGEYGYGGPPHQRKRARR